MSEDSNIQWKRNTFITFYALMKIRVGNQQTPVDIQKGDEFDYDGTILKYAGLEVSSPSIRGGIKQGWATVKVPDGTESVPTRVTHRNVAKSQSSGKDLSRIQRGEAKPINMDNLDEETVLNISERRDTTNKNALPNVLMNAKKQSNSMNMNPSIHDQEGVTVATIKTRAHTGSIDVSKSENAGLADRISNSEIGKPIFKTGPTTLMKDGVSITTSVGQVDKNVNLHNDDEGVVIAQVRNSSKKPAKNEISKVAAKIDTKLNPKIRIARSIDPSFPQNWDFSGKLSERFDRIKSHGVTPVFLEALYAAEGDQMRKFLEKNFPNQFNV